MFSAFLIFISISSCVYSEELVIDKPHYTHKNSSTAILDKSTHNSTVKINSESRRPIARRPCSCEEDKFCYCCTGAIPNFFGIQTRNQLCSQFQYNADDVTLEVGITLNTNQIYSTKVSGRDPPPICLPIPRFTNMKFCLRMANVTIVERTLSFCPVIETQWRKESKNEYNFRCLKMGQNGFGVSSSETQEIQNASSSTSKPRPSSTTEEYDEVYSEDNGVDFETSSENSTVFDVYV